MDYFLSNTWQRLSLRSTIACIMFIIGTLYNNTVRPRVYVRVFKHLWKTIHVDSSYPVISRKNCQINAEKKKKIDIQAIPNIFWEGTSYDIRNSGTVLECGWVQPVNWIPIIVAVFGI